jgi:hypothetical protein
MLNILFRLFVKINICIFFVISLFIAKKRHCVYFRDKVSQVNLEIL